MIEVEVTTRGEVSDVARRRARDKIAALARLTKGPVLAARVVLSEERDPRIPEPARAEGEINLQGRPVRAHASAVSMEAAVDQLAERLHQQIRRHVERLITRERESAAAVPGEWRHRTWVHPRRPGFERSAEEQAVIARKSFAFEPTSLDEAADALEDLGDEFLLFRDPETGEDAVLYWRNDGLLALIEARSANPPTRGPVPEPSRFSQPISLSTAVTEMSAVGHRFMFFENAATSRGNVIYRRYDGHLGLIEPADS